MNLTFRSATISDLEILRSFEAKLIEHEQQFEPTLRKGPLKYYDISALIADRQNTVILIAEIDHKPVGCGLGQIRPNESFYREKQYGYIGFMYVDESRRGKNIGGSIIRELVDWFHSNAVSEIRLKVYAGNAGAIKAYEKHGFQHYIHDMKLQTD